MYISDFKNNTNEKESLKSTTTSGQKVQIDINGEEKRLGKGSPLLTIFVLSIGPLASQTVQALYGIVNLFWVSKSIGDIGLEVFGAVYIVDFIPLGLADYLMTSLDIRVSYLFGEKSNAAECSQLYVDFIRFSLILSLFTPLIILPFCRSLIEWFGSSKEISYLCFQYLIPTTFGSFFSYLYMTSCGLIQSEGHSAIFGMTQVLSLLLNMLVFCPLFLIKFHFGIWGASLSTIVSQGIVGVILFMMIMNGKFTLKPNFNMFFKRFSNQTLTSLRVGIASLISNYSYTLPEVMVQKYLNLSALSIGEYDTIIKVWGVIEKLYQFVGGSNDAFAIGLLPAASYSFGSKRYNRMLRLFMHANWITVLISVIYSFFVISSTKSISTIWSKDKDFLKWCNLLIPKVFYAAALFPIQYTVPALLQGMQKMASSSILAVLTSLLPIPLFSTILYFTDKDNPERIMWTYTISDVFAAVVCILFILPEIFHLLKDPKDGKNTNDQQYLL